MRTWIWAVSVLSLGLVACGPGRQAAWEKESGDKLAATEAADAGGEGASLSEQAMANWEKRSDRASLEQAISLWEKMLNQNANDAATLTHLSRGYYLLADGFMRAAGEEEDMLSTFELGISAGERAMMAASTEFSAQVKEGKKVEEAVGVIPANGQPSIYWYASNLGKFAVAKGFTTTLFYKDRIYAVMQRVLEIDETFFHGAPHRYFGAFYAKAPSFAGGDMQKSKEHFDRAIELGPDYLGTKVLYAEFYAVKSEDRDLFTKLLNEVKGADPKVLPELVPEQTMEQAKAERLLSEADEIF